MRMFSCSDLGYPCKALLAFYERRPHFVFNCTLIAITAAVVACLSLNALSSWTWAGTAEPQLGQPLETQGVSASSRVGRWLYGPREAAWALLSLCAGGACVFASLAMLNSGTAPSAWSS